MTLKVMDQFIGKYLPDKLLTALVVDYDTNILKVLIEPIEGQSWQEDDWNLEHTLWGFLRGDYTLISSKFITPKELMDRLLIKSNSIFAIDVNLINKVEPGYISLQIYPLIENHDMTGALLLIKNKANSIRRNQIQNSNL